MKPRLKSKYSVLSFSSLTVGDYTNRLIPVEPGGRQSSAEGERPISAVALSRTTYDREPHGEDHVLLICRLSERRLAGDEARKSQVSALLF